jgi:hypothetical protein
MNLSELVKQSPNDIELGKAVRAIYDKLEIKKENPDYCFACDALERGFFLYPSNKHTCNK